MSNSIMTAPDKNEVISSLKKTKEKEKLPLTQLEMKLELIKNFRFIRDCKIIWTQSQKEKIAELLEFKRVKPGERIFKLEQDKIDTFHLILAGKTGIFGPNEPVIKKLKKDGIFDWAVPLLTEAQAKDL